MKNFVANGQSLQLIAPVDGVEGGAVYKQGAIIGIVVASAAEGVQFTLQIYGAFRDVPKATGQAWVTGDMLYYDNAGKVFTKTVGSNTFAGYAYENAASGDALGQVLLSH